MKNQKNNLYFIPGLISVIIPVYNTRDYLDRCVESVVNQSYDQIEIILVDDGSDDGSQKICDEWEKRDSRIRVYHKKNGGSSSARNLGMKKAKGEFIGFVDSDDYIKEDMYASLHSSMQGEVDVVCCGTALLYPVKMNRKTELFCKTITPIVYSGSEALKELLLVRGIDFSSCNKLYRRAVVREINFPLRKTCEDYPVIYEVIKRSRKVVCTGKVDYCYCYRANSMSKQQFKKRRMSYVLFTRDIMKDVVENYPKLKKCAEALYIRSVVDTIRDIKKCGHREMYESIQRRLRKVLIRMFGKILWNQYIPRVTKKEAAQFICRRGNARW